MAERRAKLILQLEDLASRGVKSLVDVYAALRIGVEAVSQSVGRLKDFVVDSVQAYAASEAAISRLNNALRNQGFYTEEYSAALQEQARQLQKVSTQSDEAILETQALLTTFGLAGEQLKKTTKAAIDLAAGLNIDLRTATLLLGKAWAGETGTLARYGLKIDETKSGAEAFAQVLDQVNGRFGGRAASDAETYSGRITRLANAWDDLKEKIGADFARSSESSITALERLTEWVDNNYIAVSRWTKGWAMGALGMSGLFGQITALIGAYQGMGAAAEESAAKVAMAGGGPASKAPADEQKSKKLDDLREEMALEEFEVSESARRRLEDLTMTQAQREQMQTDGLARMLAAEGLHEESKRLLEAQGRRNVEQQSKDRLAVMVSSLSSIAALSNAKTKELAIIGKAAAVSMTIINAHRGYGLALATIPPPFGFIMGGLVMAAGYAQAAQIAGVPLAEGGMMSAKPGGHMVQFAEAGHDEVAIPLDDDRTQERLRGVLGGGGGGNHHHWHVGVLVADDGGLMELARRVDEKLFALERRGARVSG